MAVEERNYRTASEERGITLRPDIRHFDQRNTQERQRAGACLDVSTRGREQGPAPATNHAIPHMSPGGEIDRSHGRRQQRRQCLPPRSIPHSVPPSLRSALVSFPVASCQDLESRHDTLLQPSCYNSFLPSKPCTKTLPALSLFAKDTTSHANKGKTMRDNTSLTEPAPGRPSPSPSSDFSCSALPCLSSSLSSSSRPVLALQALAPLQTRPPRT